MTRNMHILILMSWGIDSSSVVAACQHASAWESRHV